jgi:hypothetical protein
MRAILVLATALAATAGCDRTHMYPCYGQATRQAFKTQVINPAAGGRRAAEQGLDPEEAAVVSKNYRESLTARKEEAVRTPMVIIPTTTPTPGVPAAPPAGMPR